MVHEGEPRVQGKFAAVGATLAEALDRVRASVHDLRDDAVEPPVRISQMAAQVTADTGLRVTSDVAAQRATAAAAKGHDTGRAALRRVETEEHDAGYRGG